MNLGLVTIAALLLLLPGVGFIVGVNFADKNVREIVFRNTPAEIGYVVFVSVVVHLIFTIFPHFNAAQLAVKYYAIERYSDARQLPPLDPARKLLEISLAYFLAAAIVGFGPGWLLGRAVRIKRWWWTPFFVKHRWMLDLIERDESTV